MDVERPDHGHVARDDPARMTRRPPGLLLFASAQDEPRARRPTDVVLAITSAVVVVLAGLAFKLLTEFEQAISDVVSSVPGFFDIVWRLLFWVPVAWSSVVLVVAIVRGRLALVRDLIVAIVLAVAGAAAVAAIVTSDGPGFGDLLFDVDGPPVFPPVLLAVATALISTASPHVSRPFRSLGHWLIGLQLVGAVMLGAAVVSGGSAAVALGLLAASLVHLAVGSPGGRPTVSRIRLALADLGLRVDDLAPASMQREGVVLFEGTDDGGPLLVKVYGRDAGDAEVLAGLWRHVWYRGVEPTVRHTRVELVEHEGFVTLLGERAGVDVPRVVTAGSAGRGDALVVVRPIGETIASVLATTETPRDFDEAAVSGLWREVDRLHHNGIIHRRVDLDRVIVTSEGSLALGDLSSATLTGEPADAVVDRAQVLALSIQLLGESRGVALARTFGDDTVTAVSPYIQVAAMPPLIRAEFGHRKIELDDVRSRLAKTLGVDEQPLIKLRRVTWGSLLNLALLGFAAFALISLLSGLDLESFVDALGDANWWWLAFALVLAQVPRIPAAVSTMGAIERPLPLGPLTTLQFAISYVNLAIPSTAARVAVNIRFFQRFGVDATTAASAGAIDSVSGFIVQIFLFLGLFLWSDLDFGISFDTDDLEGVATIALVVIGALVVLAVLVMIIPAWRRRVLDALNKARAATGVLRSPTKLLQLFGGNLLSQLLFAVALGVCAKAFGQDLPLSSLVLINTVVTLFAGLLPVPGGMGVSEAGLTLGLTTAGVPSELAFAIALAYRFASFYLPPIWGYFCYGWLVKRRYL
jgi:uncharacterized protein (TIRG00374 family)